MEQVASFCLRAETANRLAFVRDEFLYMQVQGPLSEFLLKLSPLDANFEYTGMQELARSISVVLSEHTLQVLIVFLLSL